MISWAITTHNEGEYISNLLNQLVPFVQETDDEIVIVDDYSTDQYTVSLLEAYDGDENITIFQHELDDHFAKHKNFLNDQCKQEFIFQIDADEYLHDNLLFSLHELLEVNPETDLFLIPRINIVDGITDDDIIKYNWRMDDNGWIMFPDYQTRLYRNSEDIKWVNRVHERIEGYDSWAALPAEEEWCIYHIKTIERQREQNEYYETLD